MEPETGEVWYRVHSTLELEISAGFWAAEVS